MNKFSRTVLSISFLLVFNVNAETTYNKEQVNAFECSPEEMSQIIDQAKIKKERIEQTTYKDFSAPYQEAAVAKKVGKTPSEVTQEEKNEESDYACLNIDPSEVNMPSMEEMMDKLDILMGDASKAIGDFIKAAQDDLSKGLCSKTANVIGGVIKEKLSEAGAIFKKGMEDRIRKEKWGKLIEGKEGAKYLLDEQLNEKYSDKKGLLEWRNSKVDKDALKKNTNGLFKDELGDLYDDFDDQVDDAIE
jgi:phage host-nuclease inhibitor protein Gam